MNNGEVRSEQIPNHSEHVPNDGQRFGTVKEAAIVYNLSERVVLKRLQSGQIRGEKEGKAWLVCLPEGAESGEPNKAHSERVPNDSEYFFSHSERTPPRSEPVPNALQVLIEHQVQEVAFLRLELTAQREQHTQEIARRDVAEGEMRRLLGSAMQQAEERRQEIAHLREQLAIAAAPDPVQQTRADTPPASIEAEPEAGTQVAVSDMQRDVSTATDNQPEQGVHPPQRATNAETGRKWWHFWK